MRKLLTFVVLVLSCCLITGCKKPEEPFVDSIESVVVCSEFYDDVFYVGDSVNLNKYSLTATYKSGKTEDFSFESLGLTSLDTTVAGDKTLTLTYKEKEFTIAYSVMVVVPVNAMYKGETLEIYRGEDYNFSEIIVWVLFNNGHEEEISLTDFTIGNRDNFLTSTEREFVATYSGVSVNIPYVVTNRPIEENVDYNLNDSLNIFNETSVKIRFVNGKYIVHNGTENLDGKRGQDATKSDFNMYWSNNIVNGELTKVYFYLVNDTIYCETIE